MILYTLHRITQRYADRIVLDIDHLEIEAGRIYGLLGPNGAGKTTLLNVLAFLEPATTGQMTFAGNPVAFSRTELLALRRQVVLVDQHPIMFSASVNDNIEFGLKIRKMEKKERRRIVDEVLETVGLRSFKSAAAQALSGGETQRLALARALALAPAVLLCDEPTASVDAENQIIIGGLLQEINRSRGTTILFTTHDRLQAASLAQDTLVLESGRIVPTTYENNYLCTLTTGTDGQHRCTLQGRVELPLAGPLHGTTVRSTGTRRIHLDPEKIRLSRSGAHQSHGRFVAGKVILLIAEGEKIRMVVDIGVMLVVLMEGSDYQQERPAIGETVTLQMAPDAVTFLETIPE